MDPRIVSGTLIIFIIFVVLYLSGVFNKDSFVGNMKFYSPASIDPRKGSQDVMIRGGQYLAQYEGGNRMTLWIVQPDGDICVYVVKGGSNKFGDGLLSWRSNIKIRDGYDALVWLNAKDATVSLCEAEHGSDLVKNCVRTFTFEQIFADMPNNVGQFLFGGNYQRNLRFNVTPGPDISIPKGVKL